jgi:hypothetical protein
MLRVLLLALAVSVPSCASAAPRIIVEPPARDPRMISALDVRFADVHLHHVPIQDAISQLAEAVHRVYGWEYAFSPAYHSARDPLMREPMLNPRVSVDGSDVTAREVLSAICHQVGWSFEWTIKHDLMFQDGPGLPNGASPRIR